MMYAGRRLFTAFVLALASIIGCAVALAPASDAEALGLFTQPRYAAIVQDANTGEVLYATRADALRHPASLTKIMTLYLTFEALATGRLGLSDVITISPHAYSMMPSKISTHPGESLTVAEAIPAMTVHSANDVAVAMAERLAGSEPQFARLMTLRARELGMTNTRFVNASGLPPDGEQISTARDMAILSRAVMRDYPQYYSYFGLRSIDFHGKVLMNHNHLVGRTPGVDGMKTGYTALAGFNLVASGVRDGHRLITVVLGGPSVAARDHNVEDLLNAGFAVINNRARGQQLTVASLMSEPVDMSGPIVGAPVEQGSGDPPELKAEVEPQLRTMPMLAAARTLEPAMPAPVHLTDRRVDMAAMAATPAVEPCRTEARRHRHRRDASACAGGGLARKPASVETHATMTAEAPPCPVMGRRHRKTAACAPAKLDLARLRRQEATSDDAPARLADAKTEGRSGGYMIQVGAYKNQGQAKDHLDTVAGDFGRVVGAASPQVEHSSGNYRVRFRGFSEKQAKAACHAMAAKGEKCMVMSAS